MLRDIFVIVNGQGVRQAVIGARHRLVVVPNPAPAEPVEDRIDVGLPVVHRLELADELRGRLFVRRQGGNDAHTAADSSTTYFLDAQSASLIRYRIKGSLKHSCPNPKNSASPS